MCAKSDKDITIRNVIREDMETVSKMIQEFADFEKMPNGPKLSVKQLEHDGFEKQPPAFRCKIAEIKTGGADSLVGYALYFPVYSKWEGGLMMLEELYVRPTARRRGVGRRLFDAVAKEVIKNGNSSLDFHVHEWNPVTTFCEGKGADNLTKSENWCCYRVSGQALRDAAGDMT